MRDAACSAQLLGRWCLVKLVPLRRSLRIFRACALASRASICLAARPACGYPARAHPPRMGVQMPAPLWRGLASEAPTAPDIPYDQLTISFSRSSGPGGQNVNKVNTKAEVRFDLHRATWMAPDARARFEVAYAAAITKSGEVVITSQRYRTQKANLEDCMEKLRDMVERASVEPKERIPTQVPQYERERRLLEKKKRSALKSARRGDDY
jgi:peptidyl-tRNA hydrolase ICT1